MAQSRSVRSGLLIAQSAGRVQMLQWRSRFLHMLTWLILGVAITVVAWLIVGCATIPKAADPPPPCPLPSEAALSEMDFAGPGLAQYLGQMLRYCEGIDELRR